MHTGPLHCPLDDLQLSKGQCAAPAHPTLQSRTSSGVGGITVPAALLSLVFQRRVGGEPGSAAGFPHPPPPCAPRPAPRLAPPLRPPPLPLCALGVVRVRRAGSRTLPSKRAECWFPHSAIFLTLGVQRRGRGMPNPKTPRPKRAGCRFWLAFSRGLWACAEGLTGRL